MAFSAIFSGFGLFFYILWGSRHVHLCPQVGLEIQAALWFVTTQSSPGSFGPSFGLRGLTQEVLLFGPFGSMTMKFLRPGPNSLGLAVCLGVGVGGCGFGVCIQGFTGGPFQNPNSLKHASFSRARDPKNGNLGRRTNNDKMYSLQSW